MTERTDRRAFLRLGALSALGAWGLAGCGDGGARGPGPASSGPTLPTFATAIGDPATPAAPAPPPAPAPLTAADFAGLGTCRLTPAKIGGPTAIAAQFVRRDITEGTPGAPLRLGLRVVDAACRPVPGAAVEVWHADVAGDYSAVHDSGGREDQGPGTTFLRGTQPVDPAGIAEFQTIVPGWYETRAVHVHVRVHLADRTVLTSQLFFDDAFILGVDALSPYLENGRPDTMLAADGQAGDAYGDGIVLHTSAAMTAGGFGTVALLNLAVKI